LRPAWATTDPVSKQTKMWKISGFQYESKMFGSWRIRPMPDIYLYATHFFKHSARHRTETWQAFPDLIHWIELYMSLTLSIKHLESSIRKGLEKFSPIFWDSPLFKKSAICLPKKYIMHICKVYWIIIKQVPIQSQTKLKNSIIIHIIKALCHQ
jgi:hypothetical protein